MPQLDVRAVGCILLMLFSGALSMVNSEGGLNAVSAGLPGLSQPTPMDDSTTIYGSVPLLAVLTPHMHGRLRHARCEQHTHLPGGTGPALRRCGRTITEEATSNRLEAHRKHKALRPVNETGSLVQFLSTTNDFANRKELKRALRLDKRSLPLLYNWLESMKTLRAIKGRRLFPSKLPDKFHYPMSKSSVMGTSAHMHGLGDL